MYFGNRNWDENSASIFRAKVRKDMRHLFQSKQTQAVIQVKYFKIVTHN